MIVFNRVEWRNFMSYGSAWAGIDLDRHNHTLMVGKNGSGKSTFMDAISYGLFGKPFRKITSPNLINSVNQKGMEVRVYFTIGSDEFIVRRGLAPRLFEIHKNGVLQNQDGHSKDYQKSFETGVLGFNHKSFSQIVVLGSSTFVPFMQLTPAVRREVIEDLLDIRVFSVMSAVLKDKYLADNKERADDVERDLVVVNTKIDTQQEMQRRAHEQTNASRESDLEDKRLALANTRDAKDVCATAIAQAEQELETLKPKIKTLAKLMVLEAQIESRAETLNTKIDFYLTEKVCHVCKQDIDEDYAKRKIAELKESLSEVEDGLQQLTVRKSEVDWVEGRSAELSDEVKSLTQDIRKHTMRIELLIESVTALEAQEDAQEPILGVEEDNALLKERERLEGLRNDLREDRSLLELGNLLLKDTGIKAKIIEQYIPIINSMINKYLAQMDFFVLFELDESFQETIKSRHRDAFRYESFSEGEKMRIDLALLFTWRAIARMKNSVATNLLILDEVFDGSLDANGVEEMIAIIKSLTSDQNCFMISHADSLVDKFGHVLGFQKNGNFSVMDERLGTN